MRAAVRAAAVVLAVALAAAFVAIIAYEWISLPYSLYLLLFMR